MPNDFNLPPGVPAEVVERYKNDAAVAQQCWTSILEIAGKERTTQPAFLSILHMHIATVMLLNGAETSTLEESLNAAIRRAAAMYLDEAQKVLDVTCPDPGPEREAMQAEINVRLKMLKDSEAAANARLRRAINEAMGPVQSETIN